jgi:hypothetical protein
MINILEFIFQDFWHWAGTILLLMAIVPRFNYRKIIRKNEEEI